MNKQIILGLLALFLVFGLIGSAQAATTVNTPTASEVISGTYTLNATADDTCTWVNFSYSTDNATWTEIGANETLGTVFTKDWDTTTVGDGSYYINATSNRTESGYVHFSIDNIPDSPEFSTIMIAGLIGLLSATAILLRKKEK